MPGVIMLAGGAEFQPGMDIADCRAIELAGGPGAPIRIIPAAAAPDNNQIRAGANALRWFRYLGAQDVASLPLIDAASAANPGVVAGLRAAHLIYLLGGFPRHLGESLADSPALAAILAAYNAGAVIGGSSAGAMVLCKTYYDPYSDELLPGLGLVSNACVLPHHNNFGAGWAPRLAPRLPGTALLGIDERTGVISSDGGEHWHVYGPGVASLYQRATPSVYRSGTEFVLR